MFSYLIRDVCKDPVMQDIEAAEQHLDQVELANGVLLERVAEFNPHEKALDAAVHGDLSSVRKYVGGNEVEEVAIMNGVDQHEAAHILVERGVMDAEFAHDSARGVLAGGYSEVPLPVREEDAIKAPAELVASLSTKVTETPGSSYNNEFDPRYLENNNVAFLQR